jgi:hypothetical protein
MRQSERAEVRPEEFVLGVFRNIEFVDFGLNLVEQDFEIFNSRLSKIEFLDHKTDFFAEKKSAGHPSSNKSDNENRNHHATNFRIAESAPNCLNIRNIHINSFLVGLDRLGWSYSSGSTISSLEFQFRSSGGVYACLA